MDLRPGGGTRGCGGATSRSESTRLPGVSSSPAGHVNHVDSPGPSPWQFAAARAGWFRLIVPVEPVVGSAMVSVDQTESHDESVVFHARWLESGSHTMEYVARATTPGRFVRPTAHAEEMYNPGLSGSSEGEWFVVRKR